VHLQSEEILGVYFSPLSGSATDEANRELTLGGVDHSKVDGGISYFPLTTTSPYNEFWGIDVSAVTFSHGAGFTNLGSGLAAIVDTGTTVILLPTTVYDKFLKAAGHGASADSSSGLTKFTSPPTGTFAFEFEGRPFPLSPAQYLVPEAQ
jgi:hypothetical protein